ncbi:MAG: class I SAM-dependent methyltransferase [Desulfobacterales bacterium]|nr:class I SAM-dependent methyltransferase [Desulfobacterales bacterium]
MMRKLATIFRYRNYLRYYLAKSGNDAIEKKLNLELNAYPHNHTYRLFRKQLLPSFQLYDRLRRVTIQYPAKPESLLDIGCCRGFFILQAARQFKFSHGLGIDVHAPFIQTACKVQQHLEIQNCKFKVASLKGVSVNLDRYGGPFQTVLLLGTYHYLFWGSRLSDDAYLSHRNIFQQLSKLCSDRLIFSARLEVERLPRLLKTKALTWGSKIIYTTDHFIKRAQEFFSVHQAGCLGKYPLFVMTKKK